MDRKGLGRIALPIVGAVMLGCSDGGDAESLREGLASLPQDTSTPGQPEPPPYDASEPIGLPDSIGIPRAAPAPPADTAAPAPPPAESSPPPLQPGPPSDVRPWIPAEQPRIEEEREWGTQPRAERREEGGVATLVAVRAARNEDFDRVVLQFAGDRVPGYRVEYARPPVRMCGSGQRAMLAGNRLLRIRLQPARAHDDRGRATIRERSRRLDRPVMMEELLLTCDFEAEVEWIVGLDAANPFRVIELRDPARLVVDVRH